MKTEFLKTLWLLRFEKMRKNEEKAAWKYQDLLDQCLLAFGKDNPIVPLLSQLVREEREHERLAEELIIICRNNHPETGLLSS